ncbi:nitrate- and nitrite sensing domain-containing protein [Streptomyces polygonati]|uniref:histidine kinase n=1 Tax=Streptomyces polygonati TaxID=1617087 RepID=A0ABV8HIF3_9ACTN
MRNWRVATRLNAILLIPVLVALIFGGFRVKSSVDTWHQADAAVRTASLIKAASDYSNALELERDNTAVPLLAGRKNAPAVTAAYAATDAAARAFNAAATHVPDTAELRRRIANFRAVEPQLSDLRKIAYTRQLSGVQTEEYYVKIQHPLMELDNELGFGTTNAAAYGRTLYAISLAKSAQSLTRSIGTHILVERPVSAKELALQKTSLGSYQYLEGIALEEFQGGGTAQDEQNLLAAQKAAQAKGQLEITDAQRKAESDHTAFVVPPDLTTMITDIATPGRGAGQLNAMGITPASYMQAAGLSFNAYRSVEVRLADQASTDAAKVASDARRDALINSAIVVIALIIAFIVAGLMARAMSRSMRRLRGAAFDIAENRLPGLVDQLSRTDPGRVDTRVAPIPINTQDEIGEVARAFDQVHREAVRLAAEQALLRGNVNAIFTNLSQRNQGLIQRQLTLITELENNEADPDQLENLFKMDHLATRMRRNGENLLVLAGEEAGRQWNQPVPLVDVLRAAASEVEAYERIELVGIPETDIHGSAVTDLVHLLAELLENASSFSSPQTKVRVTATRLPDGRVMVEIHDRGIGLTAEDFADINHKLAEPPTVDVEIAKRMGLFVVGRLADRHGIRVQLRPSGEQAGTTSLVMLPEPITHGGGGEEFLGDEDSDFTVSRIVPEHEAAQAPVFRPEVVAPVPGQRTAAELGFDDSRYEPQAGLNPVGRSLQREGRRAQLEAAAADRQEDAEPQQPPEETPAPAAASYEEQPYQEQPYPEQPYQEQQPAYDGGFGYETAVPAAATGDGYQAPADGYPPAQGYDQSYDPAYQQQAYEQGFQADYQPPRSPQPPQRNGFFGESGQSYNGNYGGAYEAPYNPEYGQGEQAGYDPAFSGEGHPAEFPGYSPAQDNWTGAEPGVAESAPPLPQAPSESVVSPSLTDAGLPRRDQQQGGSPEDQATQEDHENLEPNDPPDPDESDWRSTNDEHWQRAEQVREPKAGGVTPSGLPRRVPKANLVPGAATQTPQGGPQVSRAPEDVRGRLSNLRRGVQQGRTAGTDTNGQATDSRFGGPQNQER